MSVPGDGLHARRGLVPDARARHGRARRLRARRRALLRQRGFPGARVSAPPGIRVPRLEARERAGGRRRARQAGGPGLLQARRARRAHVHDLRHLGLHGAGGDAQPGVRPERRPLGLRRVRV